MRISLSIIAVTALLVCGVPAGFFGAGEDAAAGSPADAAARSLAVPGWRYWSGDVRLTDNPSEDRTPVPAVDQKGDCAIAWDRGGDLMWMKINRSGAALTAERNLLPGGFPVQDSGFVSTCIAADSAGDFHVVAEPGGSGAGYAEFDGSGSLLAPWRAASQCATNPDNPSIAIAPGGNISLTCEQYWGGFSSKALACTLLDAGGTMVKDAVRMSLGSWDCEGSDVAVDNAGNIHAAVLTLSLGVYHVMVDQNGNALPRAPPTYLYKIGSVLADGPPSIACDGAGAVHLLWNDKPSGTGTLKYMKLDNNGNKLAAGPDGFGIPLTYGASCRGFPSIIADSRGNAYAFWSDTREGRPQIMRMMLDPRTLNDTNLPEYGLDLYENYVGNALEPKVAMDRVENMYVVWMDNRDGNYEIYFKYGFNYGVNLTMDEAQKERLLQIHPNHARSGNVTLTNMGGGPDTAELGLEVDFLGHPGGTGANYSGDGWKVWFPPPGQTVELGYLEIRNVTLNIRGPAVGVENDYIDVTVNSSSRDMPRVERAHFRAYLAMNHSMHLHLPEKVHTTGAGWETRYWFEIENCGGFDEGIELSARGPPGWDWELSAELVHLKAFGRQITGLNVTPPLDAAGDEVGTVAVTARFAEEPTVFETRDSHTIVHPVMELQLWPDRENGTVAPGGTTSYVITVKQTGNVRKPAPIMIEASGEREGWIVALDATAVSLAAGESERVVMLVSAPSGALAGDELTVNVSCQNLEGTVTAGCAVTTRVLQCWEFSVAAESADATVDPGGSALFHFEIFNTGNGPDTFWPEGFPCPAGWSVSLQGTRPAVDVRAEGIPVPAGGSGWFEAIAASPSNASMGAHRFAGFVRDSLGNARSVEFTVSVNQLFGLKLGSAEPDQAAECGARVIFPLQLWNTGNGPDTIRLNASGLPEGWGAAEFRDGGNAVSDRLALNASGSGRMAVAVVIPRFTALDGMSFNVTAFSAGGENVTIGLFLKILKPDLVMTGVEVQTGRQIVGRPLYVRLTVRNNGEATAENVTVGYWRNGVLRTTENLGRMAAGGNASVFFVWVPVEGENSLRFAVDPDDAVCEQNEANNEASYGKRLYTERVVRSQDDTWMAIAAAIGGTGVVFFLAVWSIRKPRAPSG